MRFLPVLFLLILSALGAANELDDIAEEAVRRGAPGVVIWVKGPEGVKVSQAGSLAGQNTLFRIASISKVLVATLVLKACEEGLLELDAPIPEEIREAWCLRVPGLEKITLRQLLAHRSGLPEYFDADYLEFKRRHGGVNLGPLGALKHIEGQPLSFSPGARFEYCNTNYVLLGLLLEDVYASDLDHISQRQIFAPLRLKNSHFKTYEQRPLGVAPGYLMTGGQIQRASDLFTDDGFGDGGAICSARDLGTFLEALLLGRLLKPKQLKEMTRFQATGDEGYGLGLASSTTEGVLSIGHGGSIEAYQCGAYYLLDLQITLVVFVNGGGEIEALFDDVIDDVLETLVS